MSKQTNTYEWPPNSLDRMQELLLMKKNSCDLSYDPDCELMEMQQDKNGFSELYNEYQLIVSPDEGFKKEKYFQNFDSDSYVFPFVDSDNEPGKITFVDTDNYPGKIPTDISIVIIPPETPKKQKKFHDKSYCRYILLYVFRTIENKQYAEIITDICNQFQVTYNNFIEYYRKQRILIMGYQTLKKELIYNNDSIPDQNRKKAFKAVLAWYLDKLATKHILLSKKQDFKEYIKFKNYVMSYYIHNPQNWAGNKPLWI